ncbi:hypothetical protein HanPSC8_Chr08g0311171 [Helianthus annuus]|nr:hypothetical protein HanPSC8_Chr08g0311171 [Helianthus annuus]
MDLLDHPLTPSRNFCRTFVPKVLRHSHFNNNVYPYVYHIVVDSKAALVYTTTLSVSPAAAYVQ